MANSLQGVYAPLPQSLSDSDSEKEIVMENVCANYGNKNSNIKNTISSNNCRQNGHMALNMDRDILKIKHRKPKMSMLRKIAFITSILLCCLPIIIFLWILPCSSSNTCPVKIINWEYQQDDVEFKGRINLVHSAFKNSYNLALLHKGSFNSDKILKNGVVSFMGTNGAVAWIVEQESDPIALDCTILDVDGNDIKDCLLLDDRGLKAIETVSGDIMWHVHSHDERKAISDLIMAVRLSDFNKDGIDEILTVHQGSVFLIICGRTGKALSKIKLQQSCNEITDLTRVKHNKIQFACRNGTQVKYYEIGVSDFLNKYSNGKSVIKSEKVFRDTADEVYTAGNRKLIVENNGICPHCHSSITLYDNKDNKLKLWPFYNSFVMKPVAFTFRNTKENIASLKGYVNGFVIKIWQWVEKSRKSLGNSKVYKREVPSKNGTYYLNDISERLMLIMLNNTDYHVINVSLTEVTQFCVTIDEKSNCQPDYRNQDKSLRIADLDQDNSQELVSYSTTYLQRQDDSWHLVSYFKVFRLESELPKLYGAK